MIVQKLVVWAVVEVGKKVAWRLVGRTLTSLIRRTNRDRYPKSLLDLRNGVQQNENLHR